jgi:uncharacterized protein (DUF952 family)
MEWSTYLTKGPGIPIYHMCDKSNFLQSTLNGGIYFSPTFEVDGFIHATENPSFLLEAGNHFYKG